MRPGNQLEKMGKTIYSILIIINLIYIPLPIHAQKKAVPDIIFAHINKSFYVSGEKIWYKIYLVNKNPETNVIHIGLFDASGKLVTGQTQTIEDRYVSGRIDIPIEWPDAYYRLEVITRWNLNFGKAGVYEKIIPVFNSSLPGNYSASSSAEPGVNPDINFFKNNPGGIKFRFDKSNYSTDDSVALSIEPDAAYNSYYLSLSVIDLSQYPLLYDASEFKETGITANQSILYSPDTLKFKPEKKFILEGIVRNNSNFEPITSSVLSIFISGKREFIRTSSINGKFSAELSEIPGNEIIQVLNLNPFQEHEPVVKEIKIWDYITIREMQNKIPAHDPQIDQYIFNSRIRRKLNEIFIKNSNFQYIRDTVNSPLAISDTHYNMENFRLLNNLEDFIRTIMVTSNTIKINGKSSARLWNEQKQYNFTNQPWYLSDGLFTYDESAILSTPFSKLSSIDLYTSKETIGQFDLLMIQNGILALSTINRYWFRKISGNPNTITYQQPLIRYDFIESQDELRDNDPEVPDLRPAVFWEPKINIENGKSITLRFKTTDNPGNFIVIVKGISSDGKLIETSGIYKTVAR